MKPINIFCLKIMQIYKRMKAKLFCIYFTYPTYGPTQSLVYNISDSWVDKSFPSGTFKIVQL